MIISELQGSYKVLVVDPPWFYKLRSKDLTHRNRIPYEPMKLPEILDLPIASLADTSGCILWLWFTNNHLIDAAKCIEHWGFNHKTTLTWVKVTKKDNSPRLGTGHWLRNCTEHCMIATKGNVPAFMGRTMTNEPTVLFAHRQEHSRKPKEFMDLVDKLCPGTAKLELFSRESRPGWDCWGNEAGKFDADAA